MDEVALAALVKLMVAYRWLYKHDAMRDEEPTDEAIHSRPGRISSSDLGRHQRPDVAR